MPILKGVQSVLRCASIVWALLLPGCATHPAAGPTAEQALAAGASAERSGDLQGALVEYVTALGTDPRNAEAHFRVARIHARLGNSEIASEAFQRSLSLNPDHVGALEGLGLQELDQRRFDRAEQYLHKAAARDSTRWMTFDGLGVMADLRAKHVLAQAYFGRALELQPNRASLLNNMGYSHYLMGDYARAMPYFNRALAADSSNAHAWSNLSLVYARTGEYRLAVQALEHIMDRWSAHYSVGFICNLDGKFADAERLFEAAIKLSPTYYPEAQTALKQAREGRLKLEIERKK